MRGARVTLKKPPLTPTYGKNTYLFVKLGSPGVKEKKLSKIKSGEQYQIPPNLIYQKSASLQRMSRKLSDL